VKARARRVMGSGQPSRRQGLSGAKIGETSLTATNEMDAVAEAAEVPPPAKETTVLGQDFPGKRLR
jgi:hypothetical protein